MCSIQAFTSLSSLPETVPVDWRIRETDSVVSKIIHAYTDLDSAFILPTRTGHPYRLICQARLEFASGSFFESFTAHAPVPCYGPKFLMTACIGAKILQS